MGAIWESGGEEGEGEEVEESSMFAAAFCGHRHLSTSSKRASIFPSFSFSFTYIFVITDAAVGFVVSLVFDAMPSNFDAFESYIYELGLATSGFWVFHSLWILALAYCKHPL